MKQILSSRSGSCMLHPVYGVLLAVSCFLLFACVPNPNTPYTPGAFYYALDTGSLVFEQSTYRLPAPADCAFYALHPAPIGRWLAVEWDCPSGPRVVLFDSANGRMRLAISDQTLDNRLLAWHPDGRSVYLKIGMLSFPQIIRVDVETLRAVELRLSAFVYDLTVSPDGRKTLYSLSNGIGFGSETWLGGENAQNPSQFIVRPNHIVALAQFSPDGSKIAYIEMPDTQTPYPAGELWIMDADGQNAFRAASADAGHGYPPVWSPDGTKIAFVGRDDPSNANARNLSIYDLKAASLLTVQHLLVNAPAWSPDGAFLHFTARENDTINVWRYDLLSGQSERIAEQACCAGWVR